MRTGNLGAVCLAALLVVLWMGCGERPTSQTHAKSAISASEPRLAHHGEACVHDADCRSGFCDRATCVQSLLGKECDPPDPSASALEKLPEHLCGGKLCMDGRCRSCRSDAECQAYFGMGKCRISLPYSGEPYADCFPVTTRREESARCTEDADCQSLFCDGDGTCTSEGNVGSLHYGDTCEPGVPPHAFEDLRPPAIQGDVCGGYVCTRGRCRSCTSDAECQTGSSDYKCLSYHYEAPDRGIAGKRCGNPSDALRDPALPQFEHHNVPSMAPSVSPDDD